MNKICEMSCGLLGDGRINFRFPEEATREEIELAEALLKLQVSSWKRWNRQREQKIDDAFRVWENEGGKCKVTGKA